MSMHSVLAAAYGIRDNELGVLVSGANIAYITASDLMGVEQPKQPLFDTDVLCKFVESGISSLMSGSHT